MGYFARIPQPRGVREGGPYNGPHGIGEPPVEREAHRYAVRCAGFGEAEMTFRFLDEAAGRVMVIDHTRVPRELGGRGVGQRLIARAVADSLAEGFRIAPVCSFVRVKMDARADWRARLADREA